MPAGKAPEVLVERFGNALLPLGGLHGLHGYTGVRGKQGKKDPKKIPKLQFVQRKPEPLGCELKDIADAQSRMILRMEIMKGKAHEVKPKYWSKEVGATAATTMRLSEPWFGSRRVVAGDSWFASVNTVQQLEERGHSR